MSMKRTIHVLVWGLFLGLASPTLDGSTARAESEAAAEAEDPANKLPPGFQPIRGKEESAQVDANPLVVMAYGAILAGLFIYIILIVRRQGQLSRDVAELAKEMGRRES